MRLDCQACTLACSGKPDLPSNPETSQDTGVLDFLCISERSACVMKTGLRSWAQSIGANHEGPSCGQKHEFWNLAARLSQNSWSCSRDVAQRVGSRRPQCGERSDHDWRNRLGHDGTGEYQGVPRRERLPGCGRLRSAQAASANGRGHDQQQVRQQGLQSLPRLSRDDCARRYRRHHDRDSRSLARDRCDRGGEPEEGHLRREAAGAHDCRTAGHCAGCREEQHHLADRFVAALPAGVSQSRGDRAQRIDRDRDACGSWTAWCAVRFSEDHAGADGQARVAAGEDYEPCANCSGNESMGSCRHAASYGFRLRLVAWSIEDGAVHRAACVPELALELQHRRWTAARLDRASRRYCALGTWFRSIAVRRRSKDTANSRMRRLCGTRRRGIPWNAPIAKKSRDTRTM